VVAVRTGWKSYAVAGAAVAAEVAAYLAWRPAMLRWGTQAGEASEPLPGDGLVPHPRVQSTRAITIDAPPGQVWLWIVKLGIGRAGFYTHDRVERLMFRARYTEGKHSATRIHPELQDLKVGDLVPYGAGAAVHELEPHRHLVAGDNQKFWFCAQEPRASVPHLGGECMAGARSWGRFPRPMGLIGGGLRPWFRDTRKFTLWLCPRFMRCGQRLRAVGGPGCRRGGSSCCSGTAIARCCA
jgi:hypothetical protein